MFGIINKRLIQTLLLIFMGCSTCMMVIAHDHTARDEQIFFIPNQGQWPASVRYKADLGAGAVFIEKESVLFVMRNEKQMLGNVAYKFFNQEDKARRSKPSDSIDHFAFRMYFQASNPLVEAQCFEPSNHTFNFFLGNDPSAWAGGIRGFKKLLFKGIYQGIDLEMEIVQHSLKYSFIVLPGADPSQIAMEWERSVNVQKEKSGRLKISTPVGALHEEAPLAWTKRNGANTMLSTSFRRIKNNISFYLSEGYDDRDTLIIDPVLVFASYSGSTVDNWGYSATYDEEGFLYSAGVAFGIGYPTVTGSYQVSFAGGVVDIALSKYDTTGGFLVYSTYLGGSGTEVPSSLVVNNSNELVLLGCTGSSNFPVTSNAFDQTFNGGTPYTLSSLLSFPNGSDMVICRFSSSGSQLLSSTYFGGTGNDGLNGFSPLRMNYGDDVRGEIVVDEQDNVYVVSSTTSVNLPVSANAFQPLPGGGDQDACVFKLNKDLGILHWSSYAGGSGKDGGYSISLGNDGKIYVGGGTTSANFPGMNGYQTIYGGGSTDGFILKISNSGQTLEKASYVGYGSYDQVYFVKTDKQNNVYVLGQTSATGNLFIQNVTWSKPSGGQFISKYDPDLNARIWSTAWGTGNGGPDVSPSAFMVDVCNNIYISAWGGPNLNGFGGTSGLPVTLDAFQLTSDNSDYYFLVIDKDVTQPIFATFYGGTSAEHVDGGTSRFDRRGAIYQAVCAGCGGKSDFPTTSGAWSNTNGSLNCNNGVIKIKFNIPFLVADFVTPPSGCAPYTVTFQNISQIVSGSIPSYFWDFGDGNTATSMSPVHTYTSSGLYHITLIISDINACNGADTITRHVLVLSNSRDTLPTIHICPGDIAVLGLPPSPDQTITYSWSPAAGLSNPLVSNPVTYTASSQTYELVISNGSCADTLTQIVEVHIVNVDAGEDTVVCHNTITLTATGNKPNLIYHWSTTSSFLDTLNAYPYGNTALVNLSAPTTYYVRVTDGVCSAVDSVHIDFLIIVAPLTVNQPSCHGFCDGVLTASASGGTPPFLFQWSDGQSGPVASGLCAGTYSVTITDQLGCIAISSASLIDPEVIDIQVSVSPTPCEEVCLGTITASIIGGTPPYSYLWNNGHTTASLTGLCAGEYAVLVRDANACPAYDTFLIEIISSFEEMMVEPRIDTIYKGQSIPLTATIVPGGTYLWEPGSGLVNQFAPVTMASPSESVVYYLTVKDAYGCLYMDSVTIIVKEVICRMPFIYVPNAFSPNGDNLNDVLYVRASVASDIRFFVYDRWGEKVFETTRLDKGWDGNFRGKLCDPGVFVYYLEVTCFDGQRYETKGNVTLLR